MIGLGAKPGQAQAGESETVSAVNAGSSLVTNERSPCSKRLEELRVGIAVRCDSTHHIDHSSGSRHQRQIFAKSDKRLDQIDLGDPIQRIAGFFEEIQVTQGQRFERSAESTFEPTRPPRDRTNFSQLLCIEGDDAVGLAPLSAFQA